MCTISFLFYHAFCQTYHDWKELIFEWYLVLVRCTYYVPTIFYFSKINSKNYTKFIVICILYEHIAFENSFSLIIMILLIIKIIVANKLILKINNWFNKNICTWFNKSKLLDSIKNMKAETNFDKKQTYKTTDQVPNA